MTGIADSVGRLARRPDLIGATLEAKEWMAGVPVGTWREVSAEVWGVAVAEGIKRRIIAGLVGR